MDVDPTGAAPLFLNLAKAYRANLSGAGNMGTAAGLQVDPCVTLSDLHQTYVGRRDRRCDG